MQKNQTQHHINSLWPGAWLLGFPFAFIYLRSPTATPTDHHQHVAHVNDTGYRDYEHIIYPSISCGLQTESNNERHTKLNMLNEILSGFLFKLSGQAGLEIIGLSKQIQRKVMRFGIIFWED